MCGDCKFFNAGCPKAPEEADRVRATRAYGLMDTAPEPELDRIAQLAARLFNAPMAAIIIADCQRLWFKARIGLEIQEVPRDVSLCRHIIDSDAPSLIVGDTTADPRFSEAGAVTGAPFLRFYAAAPLINRSGHRIGVVAVVDTKPRNEGNYDRQSQMLIELANTVMSLLEARRDRQESRAQRQGLVDRVAYLAKHDALTGLANRQRLARLSMLAFKNPKHRDRGFAVHVVGLDRFHEINDDHGTAVGDTVLRLLAKRLEKSVRKTNLVGRLGNDEFCVVQIGAASDADAAVLGQRLVQTLCCELTVGGKAISVAASVGTARLTGADDTFDSLTANAMLAMRCAKSEGGSRHCTYSGTIEVAARGRRRLRDRLAEAIADGGLSLAFQPKIHLATSGLHGAEALVRWQRPDGRPVPPSEFIPVAEDTGLILPLGKWVLETACAAACRWPHDRQIAVNLSPVQLRDGNLLAIVEEALAKTGLDPKRLELEITETHLADQTAETMAMLEHFRALGISLAIDDFGTGYSSLSTLWNLPFDTLKLDRAFVSRLGTDPRSISVVGGIIALAKSLNLNTVAEGVETHEQHRLIRELGCDLGQGFLYARPGSDEPCTRLEASWDFGAPDAAPMATDATRPAPVRTVDVAADTVSPAEAGTGALAQSAASIDARWRRGQGVAAS